MSAGNGDQAEPLRYEAPSAAMGERMLAILWAEQPAVYAWCLGYAATGQPPHKPRDRKRRAPDLVEPEPVRSLVGGGAR